MRRLCVIMLLLLTVPALAVADITVNGEFTTIDGFRVLRVWGSHQEMGYAHGYLLCNEILSILDSYVFNIIDPATYETMVLPVFRQWFQIPQDYQTEMDAMLEGMKDSGGDLYIDEFGRELTAEDIAVVNSIVDLTHFTKLGDAAVFGCSSICGWDDGTQGDPDTPRGTLHCRDLDWSDTAEHDLGASSLVIAHSPSAVDEQDWVSITFPGFISCLSGMNESGVGATLNMGNNTITPGVTSGHTPICFQVRESLETIDPDSNGRADAEDVWHTISTQTRIPTTIIHAFGPALGSEPLDPPSLVIESNFSGIEKRLPSDDPDLQPYFIAATNHHRVLYPPVNCWRYTLIKNLVMEDYRVDTAEAWDIENAVGGSWTIQTMLFRPDIMDLFVSASVDDTPAPQKTPVHLEWDSIFTTSPTPTPSNPSPTPSQQTPTPTPQAPTPTPAISDYAVDLILSNEVFTHGDRFLLEYRLINATASALDASLWVILDVYGMLWFYPGWSETADFSTVTLEPGESTLPVTLLDFVWPSVSGHADNLKFWGALTNTANTQIMGDYDIAVFSY